MPVVTYVTVSGVVARLDVHRSIVERAIDARELKPDARAAGGASQSRPLFKPSTIERWWKDRAKKARDAADVAERKVRR